MKLKGNYDKQQTLVSEDHQWTAFIMRLQDDTQGRIFKEISCKY